MARDDSVGWAKQAGAGVGGLGTKNTTMEYFTPVETAERGVSTEDMDVDETIGVPFATDRQNGVQYFEPSMTLKARGAGLPRILSAFMGAPTTTTPGGGTTSRQHLFNPVGKVLVAHSVLFSNEGIHLADLNTLFWDCLGQELAMDVETNDWISCDVSLLARECDDAAASPTVTADLSRRFPFYECKAFITAPSVNGGVELEIPVAMFGLDYANNIPTDVDQLGSRRLYRVKPGNRDVGVRFTPRTDLDAWWKRAVALEPESLKLRMLAEGTIIEGAIKHTIEISVPRLQAITAPVDIDAGESVEGVEVELHGAYDSVTGKAVEVKIINTVTSY